MTESCWNFRIIRYAFTAILALTSQTIVSTQELFNINLVYGDTKVLTSPNGDFAVLSYDNLYRSHVIYSTKDWSVYSRISIDVDDPILLPGRCHGFLNDSIIITEGYLNAIRFYNFHTGEIVDEIPEGIYCTLMTSSSILYRNTNADGTKQFYEHRLKQQADRHVTNGDWYPTDIFSTQTCPFILVRQPKKNTLIIKKSDGSITGELSCSKYQDYQHPYAVTLDGDHVYVVTDNNTISKVSLPECTEVKRIKLPSTVNGNVSVFVSPNEQYLAYVDRSEDGSSSVHIISSTGSLLRFFDNDYFDDYKWVTWYTNSSKFYLASVRCVYEMDSENDAYLKLLSVRCNPSDVYVLCDATKVILESRDDNPILLDIPTRSESQILDPYDHSKFYSTSVISRFGSSDSLFISSAAGISLVDFCSGMWTKHDFTYDIDYKLSSLSNNRRWIAGLTDDHRSLLIVDLFENRREIVAITEVVNPNIIRIAENSQEVFIFAENGLLTVNLTTYTKGFRSDVFWEDGNAVFIGSISRGDVSSNGKVCYFLPQYSDYVIVAKEFPNESVRLFAADTQRHNYIDDVNLSSNGRTIAVSEHSGLVRILDLPSLNELARIRVPGIKPLQVQRNGSYLHYDIESRILTSINYFGELVIQRWPEEPVSVNGQEVVEQQAPETPRKMLLPSGDNVTISVPITDPIASVACYNVLGMDQSGDMGITISGSQVKVVNRTEVVGPVFIVVKTTHDLYTYSVVF